jgi:hypothetical protein
MGRHVLILAVHVDDCMFTGSSNKLITLYKHKLNACYALTDLGPIHWLLGIKITHDRAARTISLSQSSFIDSILSRFSFADIKPYGSSMIPGSTYLKSDSSSSPEEAAHMKRTPYRQAIGSLMYIAIATHPDITFAVSILSQFLNNPDDKHWDAVKRVFRCLQNTKSFQLTFSDERHKLEGYSDADGGTQEDRHAITGYCFLFDGGAISWGIKNQELITLSTAKVEYVVATHATKEALWLHKLLCQLMPKELTLLTTIYCDNQAAIKLITSDNYHSRTKHPDQRYLFMRDMASKSVINVVYCPSEDRVADILTKALPKWKAASHANALGMHHTYGGVKD